MKREMFFATVFSAALAVGVAAQNPPPSTAQTPSQDRQVTVTGCLAQAPSTSTTGTSGAAGATATATASQYILKDATTGPGAAGSTGTSGTASSSAMGKSFKLIGGSPDDFKSNVNAKVEIKGTLQPASGAPSSATPPASASASGQSDKDMPTLRVTSVRKIADTCSGQ